MHTSLDAPLLATARQAGVLAGPAAVLAVVLFFAALGVTGDDPGALSRSPLGVASNSVALLSIVLLLLGLAHLASTSAALRSAPAAVVAAAAGTLLMSGAAWTQLVVLPALATEAPRMADQGHSLVTAGYILSFLAAGLGWLLVALRLRRDQLLGRGRVRLLVAGAVLMIVPLPGRWFLLAIAVTLLARSYPARAAVRQPVPAAG